MAHLLLQGDARRIPLADKSVHTCVTSPPYWSLRDYQTARWVDGDLACDHLMPAAHGYDPFASSTLGPNRDGINPTNSAHANDVKRQQFREVCKKCGARRVDRQIGLEKTYGEYVETMVRVFREVRRVLRDDGTLWLNLGDSYAASAGKGDNIPQTKYQKNSYPGGAPHRNRLQNGLKPKDLVGIPWRVALALQADGWTLRSDVIWEKVNPMPESVSDRPTRTHEYLFLLAKRSKYYFDSEAIREKAKYGRRNWKDEHYKNGNIQIHHKGTTTGGDPSAGRNKRSVWSIPSKPFKGSHFATFPPKLVEPCIMAGTSERGVCPACGAGWVRETERVNGDTEAHLRPKRTGGMDGRKSTLSLSGNGSREWAERGGKSLTLGWRPGCTCPAADPIPATVMDLFSGAGTTGLVAEALGRRFIGMDLSREYLTMSERRLAEGLVPSKPRREKRPAPAPRQPTLFDHWGA